MGISLDGITKAFPYSELKKQDAAVIRQYFNNREVLVHWDAEHGVATAKNPEGKTIDSISAFWFAWYAFHPDTEVFVADN